MAFAYWGSPTSVTSQKKLFPTLSPKNQWYYKEMNSNMANSEYIVLRIIRRAWFRCPEQDFDHNTPFVQAIPAGIVRQFTSTIYVIYPSPLISVNSSFLGFI